MPARSQATSPARDGRGQVLVGRYAAGLGRMACIKVQILCSVQYTYSSTTVPATIARLPDNGNSEYAGGWQGWKPPHVELCQGPVFEKRGLPSSVSCASFGEPHVRRWKLRDTKAD